MGIAMTYRGDQHLTIGLPLLLRCYEHATGAVFVQRVVVDREGMAAEFLAQLHQEGRQVITLLRSDQYEAEGSFEQVGQWQPWRCNRGGQVICEVASARFRLPRPNPLNPPVEVEVALIRDWRKLLPIEGPSEAAADQDWKADLATHQAQFWEEGWQAMPAPPAPTTPKLIPVITTGHGMKAVELAHTYFRRWNCQENSLRDWLIPLNLDTNHGYAKEQVVNSELAKRQQMLEGRVQRLEHLAQASRGRLARLIAQDQRCQEQAHKYEQLDLALLAQVTRFEEAGQTEERGYFPLFGTATRSRLASAPAPEEAGKERSAPSARGRQMCGVLPLTAAGAQAARRSPGPSASHVRTRSRKGPTHDLAQVGIGQSGDVGEGSVFWRELSTL